MTVPLGRIAKSLPKLLGGGKSALVTASRLAAVWQSVPKEQRKRLEDWARTATTKKTAGAKAQWAVQMAERLQQQAKTPSRSAEAGVFVDKARGYQVAVELASGLPGKDRRIRQAELKRKIDALVGEMFAWAVQQEP